MENKFQDFLKNTWSVSGNGFPELCRAVDFIVPNTYVRTISPRDLELCSVLEPKDPRGAFCIARFMPKDAVKETFLNPADAWSIWRFRDAHCRAVGITDDLEDEIIEQGTFMVRHMPDESKDHILLGSPGFFQQMYKKLGVRLTGGRDAIRDFYVASLLNDAGMMKIVYRQQTLGDGWPHCKAFAFIDTNALVEDHGILVDMKDAIERVLGCRVHVGSWEISHEESRVEYITHETRLHGTLFKRGLQLRFSDTGRSPMRLTPFVKAGDGIGYVGTAATWKADIELDLLEFVRRTEFNHEAVDMAIRKMLKPVDNLAASLNTLAKESGFKAAMETPLFNDLRKRCFAERDEPGGLLIDAALMLLQIAGMSQLTGYPGENVRKAAGSIFEVKGVPPA